MELFGISMWIIWLILAVSLIAIEVFTTAIVALCVAVGCLAGMVSALAHATVTTQVVVMVIFTAIAFVGLVPVLKQFRWYRHTPLSATTNMEALVGREGVLAHDLGPEQIGRMRIDGDNWQIMHKGDGTIPQGTRVRVTGNDSIILFVRPAEGS